MSIRRNGELTGKDDGKLAKKKKGVFVIFDVFYYWVDELLKMSKNIYLVKCTTDAQLRKRL